MIPPLSAAARRAWAASSSGMTTAASRTPASASQPRAWLSRVRFATDSSGAGGRLVRPRVASARGEARRLSQDDGLGEPHTDSTSGTRGFSWPKVGIEPIVGLAVAAAARRWRTDWAEELQRSTIALRARPQPAPALNSERARAAARAAQCAPGIFPSSAAARAVRGLAKLEPGGSTRSD